nr:SUMF1/EgtB/PvdO family nonheme iron enzyme [Hyphomonas sp. Mor2]
MSKVFISYRRSDSQWQTKQLYDALSAKMAEPKKNIFYDLDSMAVGFDFVETIDRAVSECDVLIAVIGPRWLSEIDPESGDRRLDDPRDFVRIEIASALKRNIQVVPVLVDGTKMPKPEDLPEDIRKLSFRHGVTLSVASFQNDMEELVRGLSLETPPANAPANPPRKGDHFDSNNYVFVSHPNDVDEALFRKIARHLMADGISLWIYEPVRFGFEPHELALIKWQRAGGDAQKDALSAIDRARCVLLLIGSGTSAGGFQTKELQHAVAQQKMIVPVVVEDPEHGIERVINTVVGRPADYLYLVPDELKEQFVPKITPNSLSQRQFEKSISMLVADVREASKTYSAPQPLVVDPVQTAGAKKLLYVVLMVLALLSAAVLLWWQFQDAHVENSAESTLQSAEIPVGEIFQDCSECPIMVVVPPGQFTMGSPESETGRDPDEQPLRNVNFDSPFAVGVFEVTVSEFRAFAESTNYQAGVRCKSIKKGYTDWFEGWSFRNPGYQQTGSHPVTCVNLDDMEAFIAWLTVRSGREYRLLSEPEWEYVARAGTQSAYWFGESIDPSKARFMADHVQVVPTIDDNLDELGLGTVPVGSYSANGFGLFDVHGNLWEMTSSCWSDSYPVDPRSAAEATEDECDLVSFRGGSWLNQGIHVRSAMRGRDDPAIRDNAIGFRVATSDVSSR